MKANVLHHRFPSETSMQSFPFINLPYSVRTILSSFLLAVILVKVLCNLVVRNVAKNHTTEDHRSSDNEAYKRFHSLPGPTPFPLRLIGNISLVLRTDIATELLNIARAMAAKFGECYRLVVFGEDYVILNSPPMVQALMSSSEAGHLDKGGFEKFLWPEEVVGLVIFPGDEWKPRRKILNRSFTYKSLQEYNSSFNRHSEKFLKDLEQMFSSDGQAHDVESLIHQFVFRVSAAALMGVEMNDDDSALYCESSGALIDLTFKRLFRPWLYPKWIWRLHPMARKQKDLMLGMKNIVSKIVKTHVENMKSKTTHQNGEDEHGSEEMNHSANSVSGNMIEVMLHNGLSEHDIFSEVSTFLAISQDATSLSILFALFALATNPNHQELCRNEVDAVFDDPQNFQNGTLNFHALSKLKYLERCIQESQRMYPATIIIRRIETPLKLREDLVIPPGANAVFAAGVLHYNSEYFPKPEVFDPDRFLPEKMKALHPYAYLPFSGGPRNCIGMKLAMIEMKILIAKILHNFEIHTPVRKEDLKITYYGTPKPAKPINFFFRKRNQL